MEFLAVRCKIAMVEIEIAHGIENFVRTVCIGMDLSTMDLRNVLQQADELLSELIHLTIKLKLKWRETVQSTKLIDYMLSLKYCLALCLTETSNELRITENFDVEFETDQSENSLSEELSSDESLLEEPLPENSN